MGAVFLAALLGGIGWILFKLIIGIGVAQTITSNGKLLAIIGGVVIALVLLYKLVK